MLIVLSIEYGNKCTMYIQFPKLNIAYLCVYYICSVRMMKVDEYFYSIMWFNLHLSQKLNDALLDTNRPNKT